MKLPEWATDLWAQGEGRRPLWAALAAIALAVTIGSVFGFFSFLGWAHDKKWPPPVKDVLAEQRAYDNDAGLIRLFVEQCAEKWLTATAATISGLDECVTVPENGKDLPANPSTVGRISVWQPQRVASNDALSEWSVMFAAPVREFTSPITRVHYYEVAIVLARDSGPRVMGLPHDRLSGLPPGPDIELNYGREVEAKAPLERISKFVSAFYTRTDGDLTEYTPSGSALVGLGHVYGEVVISSVDADVVMADEPTPGQRVHVMVTLKTRLKQNDDNEVRSQQLPLLVVESGGRWAVSDIETVPSNSGRTLTPPGMK